jgi:hypothetical protein
MSFGEISVRGFATRPSEFCAGFNEAFDMFGSPWGVTFARVTTGRRRWAR